MIREQNASNLLKINIGMDKKEVLEIMGTETIQTYFYSTQMLEAQVIPNPYRTETIETKRNGNKAFWGITPDYTDCTDSVICAIGVSKPV